MATKDIKKQKEKDEKLILGQKKSEPKEQMKFDDPGSRPDPSVERDLAARETSFKDVEFPEVPEEYTTYEELLASEEYKHALDKLAEFTGVRNIGTGERGQFGNLSNKAFSILKEVIDAETHHEQELEQLAERVIRNYFNNISENVLQMKFQLRKTTSRLQNRQSKEELQQKEEELMSDINDLTPERAKRRLINAMTQGHSVEGTHNILNYFTSIYRDIANELQRITGVPDIVEKYSIFFATLMIGYWQASPDYIKMIMGSGGGESGGSAGRSKIDTSTDPPTIYVDAMIFPLLIHEGIKGVMEFLSKEKNPENPEKTRAAMELEDLPEHEIWDIRLGPSIWRRLIDLFPTPVIENEDKKPIQYYIYANIINLPAKEFLVLMKEAIGGSENGKKLIDAMYYDITRVMDNEEVSEEDSEFRKLLDELTGNIDDDELSSFLDDLGITLG